MVDILVSMVDMSVNLPDECLYNAQIIACCAQVVSS